MSKKTILFFIFFLGAISIYSQSKNPGYMGRRFMLKINLINGARPLYFGGDIEYTLNKHFVVGIGAAWQTSMYKQVYFSSKQIGPGTYEHTKILTDDETIINSTILYAQLKYFPKKGLVGAPQGFYFALKAGVGNVDIYSNSGKSIYDQGLFPASTVFPSFHSFTIKGIPFGSYQAGLGYQKVLASRLVLDGSVNFDLTTLNIGGSDQSLAYTSTLATEFGPNTIWRFTGANTNPSQTQVLNMGLSIYFKIGFLIF